MSAELIDRIYEAAFVPELWAELFEALAAKSGSAAGSMLIFRSVGPPSFVSTSLTRSRMKAFFGGKDWKGIIRVDVAKKLEWTGFRCDTDYMSSEQRARDPVEYQLQDAGLGWQLSTYVPMPTQESVIFTFERRIDEGRHNKAAVAMLDSLRPHLARASLASVRLGLERAHATVDAMEAIGLPAAAIRKNGTVLATNPALESIDRMFRSAAFGRLSLVDPRADRLFQDALEIAHREDLPNVRSIPAPATEDHPAAVVHILPVRREAFYTLSGAQHLIIVTLAGHHAGLPAPSLLSALFDLTPAEARLAKALAENATLAEYSMSTRASLNTLKTHLKRVFEKTGVTRQADLVRLLADLSVGQAH